MEDMRDSNDLIIDVGMCDGADTAYYLFKGFRVIAIDADPILCERASRRFADEIAEKRLEILNLGIAQGEQVLTFYRSLKDPGLSSFDAELGKVGGRYEEMQIPCRPLSAVIAEFGIPHYLKIDIEGFDAIAISTLTPETAPRYISVELNYCDTILPALRQLGYQHFKLINQNFHTTSLEIGQDEWFWRTLRKAGRVLPPLKRFIRSLPQSWRPRMEWDVSYRPDGWDPQGGKSSGPFGDLTQGTWRDYDDTIRTYRAVTSRHEYTWWDVHAHK